MREFRVTARNGPKGAGGQPIDVVVVRAKSPRHAALVAVYAFLQCSWRDAEVGPVLVERGALVRAYHAACPRRPEVRPMPGPATAEERRRWGYAPIPGL